jgi:hypothetical protein
VAVGPDHTRFEEEVDTCLEEQADTCSEEQVDTDFDHAHPKVQEHTLGKLLEFPSSSRHADFLLTFINGKLMPFYNKCNKFSCSG